MPRPAGLIWIRALVQAGQEAGNEYSSTRNGIFRPNLMWLADLWQSLVYNSN